MDRDSFLKENRHNVVLTGPPRSGTTLTCYLLNKLPNTLALHEPIRPFSFADPKADAQDILSAMKGFFDEQRHSVTERGIAQSKHVRGRIPTDPYAAAGDRGGRIRYQLIREGPEHGEIVVDKETFTPDFWLIIKDPATLSALLPLLSGWFPCHAVVRNPLAILGSWNSVNHAARAGRSPVAERYDKRLKQKLDALDGRVERQLLLLDWWFRRVRDHLPSENVLRYEKLCSSGGKALAIVNPAARHLDETINPRNSNPAYDRGEMLALGGRLLSSEGAYWHFYSRQDVEDVMATYFDGEIEELLARLKVPPYGRGYADAAAGREARPQVRFEDGFVGMQEEIDYHAGYREASYELIVGRIDPADEARRCGWIQQANDLPPLEERRTRALSPSR